MLWWKHLERGQENVTTLEREEQGRGFERTTLSLPLPDREPVLRDNLLIANLKQVKTLQAALFPICTKGTYLK